MQRLGKKDGFSRLSASHIFAASANMAVSLDLNFLECNLSPVAKGFMIPTFIPFLRSIHASPQAIVVLPIPVSVPVTKTPRRFFLFFGWFLAVDIKLNQSLITCLPTKCEIKIMNLIR